ncbi:hypothetical protein OUZ56_021183 [Daphnia magna]|uniref:Uncharacterized protein n=1 Tax=Daphnia magna TaxID=35525 RepID=A0ABQ9ZHB5_9CRUS|nr:hypothetical protein OUZ56_021183 [Daphnia magna]
MSINMIIIVRNTTGGNSAHMSKTMLNMYENLKQEQEKMAGAVNIQYRRS